MGCAAQTFRVAFLTSFDEARAAAPVGTTWSSSGEGIKPFSKTDFTEDLKKFDVPTLIQICVRSYVVIELILFASGYVGRSSTSHVRLPSQPGTQSTLYSVVLPSKCSLSASASARVWWTTPSR